MLAMDVIGPIRNSKLADETTSPERQTRHIDTKAAEIRARVIAYPTDPDISAMKYSPFDRPKLGPWMTDPEKLSQYDGLIIWRWDRFVRNGQDMRDVFTWAKKYGKTVISASENIKYDPNEKDPIQKVVAEMLITIVTTFAEIEVTNTSIRFQDLMKYLHDEGRPLGGTPPFGMEPGIDDNGKKNWVVSTERTQPIVFELERRLVVDKEPRSDVVRDFTARGVLTPKDWARVFQGKAPRGAPWTGATIAQIFNCDALLGYRVRKNPEKQSQRLTVRDTEGNPIQFCSPVLAKPDGSPDAERLRTIQRAIAGPQRRVGRKDEIKNPLAGVVRCYGCGGPLNAANPRRRGVVQHYLICKRAYDKDNPLCDCRGLVRRDQAQETLELIFLERFGNDPVIERVYVEGQDRSAELEELQAAYEAVSLSLESAKAAMVIERQTKRLDQLASQIEDLQASPDMASGWQVKELGVTNKEKWASSGWEDRRDMLVKAGIILKIKRTPRTEQYAFKLERA